MCVVLRGPDSGPQINPQNLQKLIPELAVIDSHTLPE